MAEYVVIPEGPAVYAGCPRCKLLVLRGRWHRCEPPLVCSCICHETDPTPSMCCTEHPDDPDAS